MQRHRLKCSRHCCSKKHSYHLPVHRIWCHHALIYSELRNAALNNMLCKYTYDIRSIISELSSLQQRSNSKLFRVATGWRSLVYCSQSTQCTANYTSGILWAFFIYSNNAIVVLSGYQYSSPPLFAAPWQQLERWLKICNFLISCCLWLEEKTNFSSLHQTTLQMLCLKGGKLMFITIIP